MPEERDYSHRSLVDKLGVKAGLRFYVRGVDATVVRALGAAAGTAAAKTLRGTFDLILLHVDSPKDLGAIAGLATHLEPAGGLWIFHPKGKGASPSDGQVRAAGIAAGLVDNKVCAFNDTHTATRYVIPRAKR
jgi:hypothetical protein